MKKTISAALFVINCGALSAQLNESYISAAPPVVVDKNCIDGKFCIEEKEQFYKRADMPDISDLVKNYTPANYRAFVNGVLERRFPTGKAIIEKAEAKGVGANLDFWLFDKSTAQSVLMGLRAGIHELGHMLDIPIPMNANNEYYVAKFKNGTDYIFTTPGLHGAMSYGATPMASMERSRLLSDAENSKRPPAASPDIFTSSTFVPGPFGSDAVYASTYLKGDPNNTSFDSGDQGYNSLVEETLQYINSLATAYYFYDYKPAGSIGSDYHAVLNFLWWNERYLAKMRVDHPTQYNYFISNKNWRELVLTVWGRAWKYLYTDVAGQQPDTDFLKQLVKQSSTLSEIQLIREACGCKNSVEWDPNDVNTDFKENLSSDINDFYLTGNIVALKIADAQKISVDLYNINGQKIQTVYGGFLNSGEHQITLSTMPSSSTGFYFVHVQGETFNKVKKIINIE